VKPAGIVIAGKPVLALNAAVAAPLRLADDRRLSLDRRIGERVELHRVEQRDDRVSHDDPTASAVLYASLFARSASLAAAQRVVERHVVETAIEDLGERLHRALGICDRNPSVRL